MEKNQPEMQRDENFKGIMARDEAVKGIMTREELRILKGSWKGRIHIFITESSISGSGKEG